MAVNLPKWLFFKFKAIEKKSNPNVLSIIYIILSTLFFFSNQLITKYYALHIFPAQIGLYSMISGVLITIYVQYYIDDIDFTIIKRKEHRYTIIRNSLSFVGQIIVFFIMIAYLPLSLIYVIYGFTPIIVFILDHALYKAAIKKGEIFGCILSLIGIIIVLNPFAEHNEENNGSSKSNFIQNYATGFFKYICCFICFLGSCAFAFANIFVRELKSINTVVIHFYFSIIGIIATSLLLMLKGDFKNLNLKEILLFMGVSGPLIFFFFIFMTRALMIGKKGRVVICNNLQLVYSYIFEILFLNEIPTVLKLFGSLLLILGVVKTNL